MKGESLNKLVHGKYLSRKIFTMIYRDKIIFYCLTDKLSREHNKVPLLRVIMLAKANMMFHHDSTDAVSCPVTSVAIIETRVKKFSYAKSMQLFRGEMNDENDGNNEEKTINVLTYSLFRRCLKSEAMDDFLRLAVYDTPLLLRCILPLTSGLNDVKQRAARSFDG